MSLESQPLIAVILIFSVLGFVGYRFHLFMKKEEFKAQCRWKAIERLQKPTGWNALDSINAELTDAYRRLYSHD